MRTEVRIEQAIDLEHELSQRPQSRQVLEHLAEPAPLTTVEILRACHEHMPMFPDEVSLLLFGFAAAVACTFLGLAQAAATRLTFGLVGVPTAQASQSREDKLIDVLDDVKDAELMLCLGPDFGQHFGIDIGAVADDDFGGKTMGAEIAKEAAHVLLIVGGNQGEGDGKIAERIGGPEQRALTEVQFVNADRKS